MKQEEGEEAKKKRLKVMGILFSQMEEEMK